MRLFISLWNKCWDYQATCSKSEHVMKTSKITLIEEVTTLTIPHLDDSLALLFVPDKTAQRDARPNHPYFLEMLRLTCVTR